MAGIPALGLCETCQQLDFFRLFWDTSGSYKDHSYSWGGGVRVHSLMLRRLFIVNDHDVPLEEDSQLLGRLGDVKKRAAACALCSLAINPRALWTRRDLECADSPTDDWQVRLTSRQTAVLGLASAVFADAPLTLKVVSIITPPGDNRPLSDASFDGFPSSHAFIHFVGHILEIEGRPLEKLVDLNFIRGSWLDPCVRNHKQCDHEPLVPVAPSLSISNVKKAFQRLAISPEKPPLANTYFKLIDVKRRRIVRVTTAVSYITLSYVWGQLSKVQGITTSSAKWKRDGIQEYLDVPNSLPQTIEDAMLLTLNLGQQYLWVDSLCIVQDNANEVRVQIEDMTNIYSNAMLCVVATSGISAEGGLPGLVCERKSPEMQSAVRVDLSKAPDLKNPHTLHNAILGLSLPSPHEAIAESKYSQRAWTFQEPLLSRRCLIWTEYEVLFTCAESTYRESISQSPELSHSTATEGATILLGTGNPTYYGVSTPIETLQRLRVESLQTLTNRPGKQRHRKGKEPVTIDMYMEFVNEFSNRQLSFDRDVLKAFGGISKVVEEQMKLAMSYGIPLGTCNEDVNGSIGYRLAWIPSKEGSYRRHETPSGTSLRFPSWSWASWTARVDYVFRESDIHANGMTLMSEKDVQKVLRHNKTQLREFSELEIIDPGYDYDYTATRSNTSTSTSRFPKGLIRVGTQTAPFTVDTQSLISLSTSSTDAWVPAMTITDAHGKHVGGCFVPPEHSPSLQSSPTHNFLALFHCKPIPVGPLVDLVPTGKEEPWVCVLLVSGPVFLLQGGAASRVGIGAVSEEAWNAAQPQATLTLIG